MAEAMTLGQKGVVVYSTHTFILFVFHIVIKGTWTGAVSLQRHAA